MLWKSRSLWAWLFLFDLLIVPSAASAQQSGNTTFLTSPIPLGAGPSNQNGWEVWAPNTWPPNVGQVPAGYIDKNGNLHVNSCFGCGAGGNSLVVGGTPITGGTPGLIGVNSGNFYNELSLSALLTTLGALPNGMTATTQTVGDNTTKLATDAFVIANAGGSGSIQLTGAVTAGPGTSPLTTVFPAQALANGMTGTTQTVGDNTTKLATDAFVIANAGSGTPANPTATIGTAAVNGTATTFMRSDAAPAAPAATNATKGLMEGDTSTISCTAGVCSAVGGGGGITQLTGAVTAGPGSGSQAAVIPAQALANGMTGTTQTVGDNTTKLATDAFVVANAGVGNVTGSGAGTTGDFGCVNNTSTPVNTLIDCSLAPTVIDDPTTTGTISTGQWRDSHALVVTTASQTITVPATSGLARNGSVIVQAIVATTLQATGSDVIQSSSGTTGAGGSISLAAGTTSVVDAKVSGVIKVTGNNSAALPTIANGHILGNATGGSAAAQDTTVAAGTGISVAASGGIVTITNTSPGSGSTIGVPQGRLTLTSHTPVLSADTAGATTIFYDAYNGATYPNFNGTSDATITVSANETSDALGPTAPSGILINQVVDVWGLASGIVCHATDGSGHGWSSDTGGSNTARGTGYSQLDKLTRYYITNANSITHCYNGITDEGPIAANQGTYLGTFWTLKAAGAVDMVYHPAATNGGADPCLCLFNAYNRTQAISYSQDQFTGANWAGTGTSTWAVTDAGSTNSGLHNRINWVDGLAVETVDATYAIQVNATVNTSAAGQVGIVFDATTGTPFQSLFVKPAIVGGSAGTFGNAASPPVIGAHFAQAMEWSTTTGTLFAFGGNNSIKLAAQQ